MSSHEAFAVMLTGGHHNSLGRTVEVVAIVLDDQTQFEQLFECYFQDDELVRLRTSNAMKRIWRQRPEWFIPYLDRFLTEVSQVEQPSTRWTLAQLFRELDRYLTLQQRQQATELLRHNLEVCDDWIVISQSLQTLAKWARKDDGLKEWLLPVLMRFSRDPRKSVGGQAQNLFDKLYA